MPLLQVLAYVSRVQDIGCEVDHSTFTLADVESNIVRCPDQVAAVKMIDGEQLLQHAPGPEAVPMALVCMQPWH
jgi:hypothetical protein